MTGPPGGPEEALLARYLDEMYRWNRRLDLTSVPAEAAGERHAGDARRLLDAAPPPPGASVVDVGSGNGVPGVVIAILRPDARVTLVESDRRKAGFLTHVCGLLGLSGCAVLPERVESVAHDPEFRETFDLAVSRAAAPPAVLAEVCLPLVRIGGALAALVGDAEGAAAASRPASSECGGGAPRVAAPGVLVIPKVRATPHVYPRRAAWRRPLR